MLKDPKFVLVLSVAILVISSVAAYFGIRIDKVIDMLENIFATNR